MAILRKRLTYSIVRDQETTVVKQKLSDPLASWVVQVLRLQLRNMLLNHDKIGQDLLDQLVSMGTIVRISKKY